MYKRFLFIILVTAICVSCAAAVTVAPTLNYQGKLTNSGGNPLTGSYTVTFRVYEAATGGTALSTDTHTITADKGLFTTAITIDPAVYDGRALWLGVMVGNDPEMTPRQELRPVPYALSLRPGALITSSDLSAALNLQNKGLGIGLNVSTNGDGGTGVNVYTTGFSSSGIKAETYNQLSNGVYSKNLRPIQHGSLRRHFWPRQLWSLFIHFREGQ